MFRIRGLRRDGHEALGRRRGGIFLVAICAAATWNSGPAPFIGTAVSTAASAKTGGGGSSGSTPYLTQPAISPNTSEIAFVSGGGIWVAPSGGGAAHLLVSGPAVEARPLYSPDGKRLAFISTRTGGGDIYILDLASGDLRRLTYDDAYDQLDAWSRDGKWIYFSSSSKDIAYMNDIYRIGAEGGTPMPVTNERYTNEYFGAPSPTGDTLAFTARGLTSEQWWRKGHSHIDESEIWTMTQGPTRTYSRVSEPGCKSAWPMWGADGRDIYYVSDRDGAQNIWVGAAGQPSKQVSHFRDGRVLWPSISYDGSVIVLVHDFGLWKIDTRSGNATAIQVSLYGSSVGPGVSHLTITDGFTEMALAPDGKKIAVVARGEVFAASAKDGGDAFRVTHTPEREYEIAWAPDSKRLVYVSDREDSPHLFLYDFASGKETRLTDDAKGDSVPEFSHDGKSIAFVRGSKELRVVDLASGKDRFVSAINMLPEPLTQTDVIAWSPDDKWIAFASMSERMLANIYAAPSAGGAAREISQLANSSIYSLSWSPDGTFVLFDTGQRTETREVARVDVVPRVPRFREDQFRDLFREENVPETKAPQPGKPAGAASEKSAPQKVKSVEIAFDGISQRLSFLPTGLDVVYQAISPDGKTLLMIAVAAGQENLYTFSLDELSPERPVARQLTSTPGAKDFARFAPDGKEVYYVEHGRVFSVSTETRQPKPVPITAEMDVDFSKEKMEVFKEAWTYLRDNFFDPGFHGTDWEGVRRSYEPRIAGARTPEETREILELMVGELNSSHLGTAGPRGGAGGPATGRLGLGFDIAEYERSGKLKISEVLPLGPAAVSGKIAAGNYLTAVDGTPIGRTTNLDQLLEHRIGREVRLTIADAADGAGARQVEVKPIDRTAAKELIYRQWVESNRDYVAKASGGRLGYVHMPDMSSASLARLYRDLDEKNESRDGVIIDIRNNDGGFVNVYAIDVLARRGYLNMSIRGIGSGPARTMLGQRALERPTILLTNMHSLSDAEDFAEGYRALGLGKVVGEPTAGWIIYTSSARLIDGSSVRLPFIRIRAADGSDMEMHPRAVDIPVTRSIGEGLAGKDSQLDAAINEMLSELGHRD